MKKKPVLLLAIVLMAISLFSCGQKGPLPPADKIPPRVSLISPTNGEQNVPVNCSIAITFSEPMNAATINEQTITLATGNGNVQGTVTYSGVTAVFKPASNLDPNTIHTVTVDGSVADMAGNVMSTPYGYIFITGAALDTTPPGISATNPANGAVNVSPNVALSITFSEPVSQSTITFVLSVGGVEVPCTMTYSGATAIFTPSTGLAYGTQYTAVVKAGVTDLAGNAMPSDYGWTFTIGAQPDTTPPSVIANTPGIGATNVGVNTSLNVTFSEAVDQSTITFVLSAGSTTVPFTMSYSGTTAIFTPSSSLSYNTLYTATVNSGVKDLAGNAMPNSYFWSFTTGMAPDTTPPGVLATNPDDLATSVAPNAALSVTFTEPVDQATIAFVLSAGSATVPFTMTYSGSTAIFTPASGLAYSTPYSATVNSGVKDLAGNAMPNSYSWSFTTGKAPDTTPPSVIANTPGIGATDVSVSTSLTVTFSEAVDESTINFVLSAGSVTVPFTMAYSDTTAVFTPASLLSYNTPYIAKVKSGVKDLAGNPMPSNYSWSFTTEQQPTFTITATAGTGGSISPAGLVSVNNGGNKTFTVTPNVGYHIVNLLADGVPIDPPTSYTFTDVTSDHTISASFAINTFAVNFVAGSNGSLTGTTSQTVNYGDSTTAVTAVPAANYHFVNWTGTNSFVTTTANPLTVTNVTAAQTITANFAIDTFAVNFVSGSNGSLTGNTSQTVNYGGSATAVTAAPATGYHFVNWTGTGGFVTTTTNPLTLTNVTAAQTITANFAVNTFTVSPWLSGGNGAISPNTNQTVNYNNSTTFTLSPVAGYHAVMGGTCGGTLSGDGLSYTTNPVTADCTVTVSFAINILTVTPSVSTGNGSISPNTPQTVNYNETTAFTLTPGLGYHIGTVSGTCGGSLAGNIYSTNPVTANCTVSVNFAIDTFAVNFVSGGNGTLTGTTSQTVNYGGSTSAVTAVPATGYHFVNWTGDNGFVTTTANPVTITNVTASQTITANFTINTYTVTPSVSGGPGSISPSTPQTANYNGTTTFTLSPSTGYHAVMGGTCGGTLSGDGLSYTTNQVTADCSVVASFAINTYTVTPSSGGHGGISPNTPQTVNYNTTKTFTLTPNTGYHVNTVTGTCGGTLSGDGLSYTTNQVTADCTVVASFVNTYTVTPSVSGGIGSISPSTPQTVSNNGTTSFTLAPGTGYHVDAVGGTCGGTLSADKSSYTTNKVTANCTVVASFAINTYTITATAGTGGSITPAGAVTVNYGDSPTFTITPDTGYGIQDVLVDSISQGAVTSYSFTNVTADRTISATFVPLQ